MEEWRRVLTPSGRRGVRESADEHDVRVLDINAGVLPVPRLLSPGSRGSLRFTLAGAPFLADIQIRRVTPGSDQRPGIGLSHICRDDVEHRQLIERFMNND